MSLLERDSAQEAAAGYLAEAVTGHGRLVFVAGEAGVGKTVFVDSVVASAGATVAVALGACDGSATPAPLGPLREMLPDLPAEVWPDGADRHEVFTRLSEALRDPVRPFLAGHRGRALGRRRHPRPDPAPGPARAPAGGAGAGHLPLRGDHRAAPAATGAGRRRERGGHPPHRPRAAHAGRRTAPGRDRRNRRRRGAVPRDRGQPVLRHGGDRGRRERRPAERARRRAVADGAADGRRARRSRGGRAGRAARRAVPRRRGGARQRGRARRGARRRRAPAPGGRADVPPRARAAVGGRGGAAAAAGSPSTEGSSRRSTPTPAADPARRAHHAEAAGLGDEAARHALVAAGRAASLGAHKEAVQQYERVLRHSDGAPAEHRARLLAALSYERYVTGRIAEALDARREALAIWVEVGDVDEIGDAQRWLSRLSWFAGDSADAKTYAIAACETLAGRGTPDEAMALSNRAQLTMLAGDLEGTRDWAGRALRLLDAMPDGPSGRGRAGARAQQPRHRRARERRRRARGPAAAGEPRPCRCRRPARARGARLHQPGCHRRAPAPARGRPAAPRGRPRLLPRAGPGRLGPLHAGLARHQPAVRGPARGGDRPGRAGPAQPPRRRGQPDRAALRDRPGAGVDGAGGVANAARRGAGARHRHGRGPTRLGRRRGGVRDRLGRRRRRGRGAHGDLGWELVQHDGSGWTRGQVATWLPPGLAVEALEPLAPPYLAELGGDWQEAARIWGGSAAGSRAPWPWPAEVRAKGWPRRPSPSTTSAPRRRPPGPGRSPAPTDGRLPVAGVPTPAPTRTA